MGTRIISKLNLLSSILSPAGEQRLMAPADAPGAIFFVIFAIRRCKGLSSAFQPHEHRFLQARNGFMAAVASAWVAASSALSSISIPTIIPGKQPDAAAMVDAAVLNATAENARQR
jgi:hypothetical protein